MTANFVPLIGVAEINSALLAWRDAHPDSSLLVLLPEAERQHIELLQAQCRSLGLQMVGAVFPALVADQGFVTKGLQLITVPRNQAFLVRDLTHDPYRAAIRIAQAVMSREPGVEAGAQPTLFLIFDAMVPVIASILRTVHQHEAGRVRFAGANAGSESFTVMPCLFDADHYVDDAVVGIVFPEHVRFSTAHAYPVSKALFCATATEANRIDQIDGRPAMTVYRELVKAEYGVDVTPDNFYDFAAHYPFGLVTPFDVLVRIPVALTEAGAIYCVGEIPRNASLRLLRAPELGSSRCVNEISSTLQCEGIRELMVFYCAGRRMHFGAEGATTELAELRTACGAGEMVGALSLGEIATDPDTGEPVFHNAALVCAAGAMV